MEICQAYGVEKNCCFESQTARVLIYVEFTAVIVLKYMDILSLDCITTIKMKLFYSPKAGRPQGGTLMYTLFVLIYDLLNISHKSLTLLTATFFEWKMKEDSPGYTLLSLIYMNTSR